MFAHITYIYAVASPNASWVPKCQLGAQISEKIEIACDDALRLRVPSAWYFSWKRLDSVIPLHILTTSREARGRRNSLAQAPTV